MKKTFFMPQYNSDTIKFGDCIISVSYIKDLWCNKLWTTTAIAEDISTKVGKSVSRAAIKKIIDFYHLELTPEQQKQKQLLRAKVTASNLQQKYGKEITNVFQLSNIKQKAAETKTQRYGNATYNNMEKNKQTCLEKYGVESYSATTEYKEKVKQTNLQKFGTTAPAQNKEVMAKMKATCLERYGVDNYWKANSFLVQQQQKYFEDHPNLTDEYKEVYRDREKLAAVIESQADKTIIGLANHFGISRASMNMLLAKHNLLDLVDICHQTSHYEKEIADFIGSADCICNDRTVLDGLELDIYVPKYQLGIEINGDYWHSSLYKDHNYHLNKSKLAASKGIRLIHIYEYEWLDPIKKEKIKLLLNNALSRNKNRIYARQCVVKKITNKEAKVLNEAVHLQGHRDAAVTYGLFYKNELVQLMSFSRTKYNLNLKDNTSWEIIRGCPGSNNTVIGGVSKLFKHFIDEYKPSSVFSYCDFNKFDGKSYEELGMTFIGYTAPDMKWLLKSGQVVNRKPSKHAELKAISIAQIFGAGSKKYIWKAK